VKFTWDNSVDKVKFLSEYNEGYYTQERSIGFIAQDVEMVVPEIVWTEDDGYKLLQTELIVALSLGSIKEQQKKIDSIYKQIEKVKELINA
jgi:hypothetical protein